MEICAVQFSWGPVQVELFLGNPIFEPMVSHVKGFGFLHADRGVQNTVCRGVVGFQGNAGGRLLVAHFFKSSDHGDGFLGVQEKTASFSFGGRGRDCPNCLAKDMYGSIGCWIRGGTGGTGKTGQEKVTGGTAAGIGKYKIGSIGADGENHVACVVTDGGIRVSGEVIK